MTKIAYVGLMAASFYFLNIIEGWGLVPLDGIILGKAKEELQYDPLDYIFKKEQTATKELNSWRRDLGNYAGIYREGENLENSCRSFDRIRYSHPVNFEQAVRSVVATLQYIGLDATTRAIAGYARELEFSNDEFERLTNRLITNYCSRNLTVIGLKQLAINFKYRFDKNVDVRLPSIKDNPLFSSTLKNMTETKKNQELNFLSSVNLFRSFCSWGGDSDDLRLMTSLVNNPLVMSIVIRHLLHQEINWDEERGINYLTDSKNTVQVICRDLICRKVSFEEFKKNFPHPIGSVDLKSDLNRLYCQHFRDKSFNANKTSPTIKGWHSHLTEEDKSFMSAQFIALISGIPDFLLAAETFSRFENFLETSYRESFERWAQVSSQIFSKDMLYEETLKLESVGPDLAQVLRGQKPKLVLEANLGEVDRTFKLKDKLNIKFNIKISRSFLRYIRQEWENAQVKSSAERERIQHLVELNLIDQINQAKSHFIVAPWNENLEKVLAYDLLQHVGYYHAGGQLNEKSPDLMTIPVEIHYGLFAMKYIRYRYGAHLGLPNLDL